MGISNALIFSLLLVATTTFTTTRGQFSEDLVPQYTHSAPAPAPSHHPRHGGHHPGHGGHHRHLHSPPPAAYPPTTSPPPSKPPTTTPPPAKPPTATPPPAKPPTYPSSPPSKPPTPSPPPVKPPTQPPVKPPTYPPVKPPVSPPAKPPVKPPVAPPAKPPVGPYVPPVRKYVAVQGVVFCKSCNYTGVVTLLGASPLAGAKVELRCNNTKYPLKQTATTDKNGYFFMEAPKQITTFGARKCRVYLAQQKPNKHNKKPVTGGPPCSVPTNLNGGVSGAFLFLDKRAPQPKNLPFSLYSVGPFAFESPKCSKHTSVIRV